MRIRPHDFPPTSQGNKEQIFVHDADGVHQTLSVLKLSYSVDDTVRVFDSSGSIYTTDNSDDTIYKITGPFSRGAVFVADTPVTPTVPRTPAQGPGSPPTTSAG